jgi:hypothetical protein
MATPRRTAIDKRVGPWVSAILRAAAEGNSYKQGHIDGLYEVQVKPGFDGAASVATGRP